MIGDTVIDRGGKAFSAVKGSDTVFEPLTYKGADGNPVESTEMRIANASGLRMPDTGGIGTTVFYTCGGALAVAAGIVLAVRKRADGDGEE